MAFLSDKKGEGFIDVAVFVIAASMFLVVCLSVFEFFIKKQNLDYFAKEMIDAASSYGTVSGPVDERYEMLCGQLGISPECDFTGTEYFKKDLGTVQLGETIVIKLTLDLSVRLFGFLELPVTVTAVKSGFSQQYWK
ncbi:MAG: DUF4320 family protein [Clostridia bacterium]|nr:DUF4320 family protein [Clostridia bacterium]MCR5693931.1 DUF4320 family protein [Clostridia bacterium]